MGFYQKGKEGQSVADSKGDRPTLVAGSPTCTISCTMVNPNWGKLDEEEKQRRLPDARQHPKFCTKIYRTQHEEARHLLHEPHLQQHVGVKREGLIWQASKSSPKHKHTSAASA